MKPGSAERIKTALAALLLAVLVAAFFLPFLQDRAIVVERDALPSLLPMKAFLARALRHGAWPWWNPAPALGKPFFAEWNTAVLYPPSALLLVRPFSRGANLFFVAHYGITATGALLFLRAIRLAVPAALLGAVVWTFGGPMLSLGHLINHLAAIAWLPWVLWAWQRPRDIKIKISLAAAALAMPLLAGSPEMAVLIAGALLAWSRDPRSLAAPALAAGIVAVQLVPTWAYLRETYRGVHGLEPARVLAYSATPGELLEVVLPGAPDPERLLPQVYVGLVVVALAVAGWLAAGRRERLIAGLALIGLTLAALGANTPLLPWLGAHLPLAALLRYPEKALLGVHALLALGAAVGLSSLLEREAARAAAAPPACEAPNDGAEMARPPRRAVRRAAVASRAAATRRAAVAAALVVAATTLDLARANRGLLHAPPPAAVLAPPALARAIRAGSAPPHRYYANAVGGPDADSPAAAARVDREILFGATGELYGLANANTPASLNLLAHERLQRALGAAPRERALDALAALGVKYVTSWLPLDRSSVAQRVEVATRAQAPASDPAAPVAARLYRLLPAADRAYVATRIERAASADEATSRFLQAPPGEHAGFAVVEEELAGVEASAGEPRDAVRWVVARADRLALDVRLERSALVVVNDTLAPGWSAALDGVEARLVRVNGVVRGVVAPAGRHRIEMRYRPPGLGAGILLSLVSVALVLALCGGGVAAQVLRPLRDAAARPLGIPARGSPGH